jgi:UDPglucose 6-dehydrogenase/GDP-mannose 6-dehydrogenase
MDPDRIVLGALDAQTLEALELLYAPFSETLKVRTNPRTAELIKYGSNALLATAISFSNELANLCTALGGVDIVEVMQGVHAMHELNVRGLDGRSTRAPITSFLQAGCGFGGSCLPKDVNALVAHGEALGSPMRLLSAVLEVNDAQPSQVLKTLDRHFEDLTGLKVGVLGLAFKPGTDDVRGSPSITVIQSLLRRGAQVTAFDPIAESQARAVLGDSIAYARTLADCLDDEDAVLLLTRWKEFEAAPALLSAMKTPPLFIDGRRQLAKAKVPHYAGIGL